MLDVTCSKGVHRCGVPFNVPNGNRTVLDNFRFDVPSLPRDSLNQGVQKAVINRILSLLLGTTPLNKGLIHGQGGETRAESKPRNIHNVRDV